MYCDQCGEKIKGDKNHQCKQVGSTVTVPKKKNSKKKGIIAGLVASVFLVAVVASVIVFVLMNMNTVTAFGKQVDEFKVALEENDLGDDKSYYDELLEKSEKAMQNKDIKNIKYIKRELEDGFLEIESIVRKNEQKVIDLKEELESQDRSGLYAAEVNALDAFKDQAQSLVEGKKYSEAMITLTQWEDYLKGIESSGNTALTINQVDVSNYPTVKMYLRMQNLSTDEYYTDLTLGGFYLSEKIGGQELYTKKEVQKAVQLNETENLNINLVADVSGSMAGYPMNQAKSIMQSFLSSVQFQVGDQVSLISFADHVYSDVPFSSNYNDISYAISNLNAAGATALYDALYVAINQTAMESGAKCIIAFTDGMDNGSECTPEIVTELATRYNIPIFIIGVGDSINSWELEQITNETGGFYRNINSVDSLEEIYNAIYRQQKEVYLIEYQTDQTLDELNTREVYINYMSGTIAARSEYEFLPATLMETTTSYSKLFTNDFIIYDSDSRYLTVADLRMLNPDQLRLARNEIYARRGRYFLDQGLQNHFNNLSWYNPSIGPDDFKETIFNDYERANAYFIRDYENLHGFN